MLIYETCYKTGRVSTRDFTVLQIQSYQKYHKVVHKNVIFLKEYHFQTDSVAITKKLSGNQSFGSLFNNDGRTIQSFNIKTVPLNFVVNTVCSIRNRL